MKSLRLLLWSECNRACPGCCNKQYDLTKLPVETDYSEYNEIILTGGEPMLYPERLPIIIEIIRHQTGAPIYMYTAKVDDTYAAMRMLDLLDGITVTLHDQADVKPFKKFSEFMPDYFSERSLRLNVFKGVNWVYFAKDSWWQIKDGIVWLDPCPMPENEVFKQWGLWE